MPLRTLRGKRGRYKYLGKDRAVATAVVLAATIVLLLTGFSGTSGDMRLPRPAGWLYVGAVVALAAIALVWLFSAGGKPKGQARPALKTTNPHRNKSNKSQ
jgi:hypothetical protein